MKIIPIIYVSGSAAIDIAANMMLEKSDGFRRIRWGFGAVVLLWIAFALLGQAVKGMDLAVAYAMWGAIGITGTAICGRLFYQHRLKPIGWIGILLVTVAVIVLSVAE
ncbi:DMT family transporter [Paraburkholderia lacunae]|uniref:Spermidine export protein MdtI n=1 Tax=Paraburkholderia lacunae TaxID=2211104 RepID=A0A370NF75_9BURK|nr:multidrug efflux SMR transporter [Paraburkholderia lacunae]RDK04259.1 ligand-binding protein SH3 [Paraburkholderia lacunae]